MQDRLEDAAETIDDVAERAGDVIGAAGTKSLAAMKVAGAKASDALEAGGTKVAAAAQKGGEALGEAAKRGAQAAKRGARAARAKAAETRAQIEDALDDEELSALERSLREGADLPELGGSKSLLTLAVRLDREGDFWRTWALDQRRRATNTDRAVMTIFFAAGLAVLALVGAAFVGVLFGGTTLVPRMWLVLGCGGALALISAFAAHAGRRIRAGYEAGVDRGLARAARAEAALHRIGLLLTLAEHDEAAFTDALRRELDRQT